ncbi:hypothetical protein [uncultured Mitsuokella sp.]|jgi:hypothetical protein|uniref:hypothetical protein n=1 Tax=uncultured Mitsuokella sp. TaxID=453120 RepID=UPI0026DC05B9|nr:hypothetical protein [uncultured Mitsuokella sp.]
MKTINAIYDKDFNGIIAETEGGHRIGWQVLRDGDGTVHLPRFVENDGVRTFWEDGASDCESFDEDHIFESLENLYDAVESAVQKYMTVTEDGDIVIE